MIHTGIIGGASAITGIIGGSNNLNGTNTAIDAITGGLTGLDQNTPKIEKDKKPAGKAGPKPKAEQADRNPERTEKKGDTK